MGTGLVPADSSSFLLVTCLGESRTPNLTQIFLLKSAGVCAWKHFAFLAPFYSRILLFNLQSPLIASNPNVLISTLVCTDPPSPVHRDLEKHPINDAGPAVPSRLRLSRDLLLLSGLIAAGAPAAFRGGLSTECQHSGNQNLSLSWLLSIGLNYAQDGCPAVSAAWMDEVSCSRNCCKNIVHCLTEFTLFPSWKGLQKAPFHSVSL